MKIFSKIFNSLFPEKIKCIVCGEELNNDNTNCICPVCLKTLPFINGNKCIRCSMPLSEGYDKVCFNCKAHNYSFTEVKSVFAYEGNIRNVIYKYKYEKAKYLGKYLSKFLVPVYAQTDWQIDFVIAVPLHKNREKNRGYNQSKIMAETFCEITKLPELNIIKRIVDTPSQTLLSHEERTKNLKDAFEIDKDKKNLIKDKNVLVIDDVYTTGATMQEITKLLQKNGAKNIYGLTLAHAVYKNTK